MLKPLRTPKNWTELATEHHMHHSSVHTDLLPRATAQLLQPRQRNFKLTSCNCTLTSYGMIHPSLSPLFSAPAQLLQPRQQQRLSTAKYAQACAYRMTDSAHTARVLLLLLLFLLLLHFVLAVHNPISSTARLMYHALLLLLLLRLDLSVQLLLV